jgi:hypothetical protein
MPSTQQPLSSDLPLKLRKMTINFLDITIKKEKNQISFDIYRNPTSTDIIIPQDSCYPIKQKLSAIRYLQNRHSTYPTDEKSKQKEQQIINQILHNNQYDPSSTPNQKHK